MRDLIERMESLLDPMHEWWPFGKKKVAASAKASPPTASTKKRTPPASSVSDKAQHWRVKRDKIRHSSPGAAKHFQKYGTVALQSRHARRKTAQVVHPYGEAMEALLNSLDEVKGPAKTRPSASISDKAGNNFARGKLRGLQDPQGAGNAHSPRKRFLKRFSMAQQMSTTTRRWYSKFRGQKAREVKAKLPGLKKRLGA